MTAALINWPKRFRFRAVRQEVCKRLDEGTLTHDCPIYQEYLNLQAERRALLR